MANRGEIPGHLAQRAVPGRRELFPDAARALMLLGAAAAVSTAAGNAPAGAADAAQAALGLLLWLLGVWLLALVPAAARLRQAALVAADMANAVLKRCFTPWN